MFALFKIIIMIRVQTEILNDFNKMSTGFYKMNKFRHKNTT